jgi:hypothetical protein
MSLIRQLKHIFIPHEGNQYKPHFFREHVMLSLLIGSIFMLLVSFTSYTILRTTDFGSSVVASVLIDLTNQTRIHNNLPPLLRNDKLQKAAELKGEDMVTRQYFSHYAPDGTSPWYWFKKVGYDFSFAGENLAINFSSSRDVEKAWLASQKHKDNILNQNYEDTAIATIHGNSSSTPLLFVVQLFGKASSTPIDSNEHIRSASFYEKILFNTPYYAKQLYLTLIVILLIALCLMVAIEIRVQHYTHIAYGVLLGILVGLCMMINSFLL